MLILIRLLCSADGVSLEPAPHAVPVLGFLFDMNRFFQRLLSHFLRENLPDGRIEDERTIRNMLTYEIAADPRSRPDPLMRPDFAVFRTSTLKRFADAKYRDVWTKSVPIEWLYHLHAYAWAASDAISVMLYATTNPGACEARMRGPPPTGDGPSTTIVLLPVHLAALADLVARRGNSQLMNDSGSPKAWYGATPFDVPT